MNADTTVRLIFAVLAGGFLTAAVLRLRRERRLAPASRTWFIIGIIFAAVSLWPRS